jgi:hypothetical protein
LENTHFSLVATVEKLYSMLRNGESWLLDEPRTNDNGMLIIHDVAKLLGCLRESPDNLFWETNEFQKSQDGILDVKQELMESREEILSWDHPSSPQFEQPDSLFRDSETTSTLEEDMVADYLLHEDSMYQEGPIATHQDSQQQSHIPFPLAPRLDTGVNVFERSSSKTGSLCNPFSEPNFCPFDRAEAIHVSPSDIAMEVLDWTLWSDDLAWRFFTDL